MHDQLADGRNYRLFNVIDDFKREGLAIEAGFSLPTIRVIRTLNSFLNGAQNRWRSAVTMDPNLSATNLQCGRKNWGSELITFNQVIHKKNAYIELHNKTIRYSWVSKHLFDTLEEVQDYATQSKWRKTTIDGRLASIFNCSEKMGGLPLFLFYLFFVYL
ncbi:integrase [Vibrio cholerae]|nr:integrase [Vibrio cholerae]